MSEKKYKSRSHSQSSIFGDISEEKMQEIVRIAEKRIVPAGTLLFKQDEAGDRFYLIRRGRVRVYKTLEDGSQMELSVMTSGESFGEMALLTGEPRSANVETVEETHLTVLTKEQFDRVVHDYPGISLRFVRQISSWLKKDEMRLEEEAKQRGPSLSWVDFLVIAIISLFCGIVFNQVNPNGLKLFPKRLSDRASFMIDPGAVQTKFKDETLLFLDARPDAFFKEEHIEDAVNLPYSTFEVMYLVHKDKIDAADRIVVYGRTISSLYDEKVAERLDSYWYKNVSILSGGLNAWKEKGYPTAP